MSHTSVDWSYVAGYFDGEGHVGLHKITRYGRPHMTRYLQWVNTNRESLEAIRSHMGVGRIRLKGGVIPPRRLPCYILTVTGKANLLKVLDQLIPRLIIKRVNAERLRQYLILNVKDLSKGFGKAVALTTEQLSQWYHTEGLTFTEIAKTVGVEPTSIARVFRSRGLKARPAGARPGKAQGAHSEETKKKIREAHARRWEDPEFREAQLARLALGPKKNAKPRP